MQGELYLGKGKPCISHELLAFVLSMFITFLIIMLNVLDIGAFADKAFSLTTIVTAIILTLLFVLYSSSKHACTVTILSDTDEMVIGFSGCIIVVPMSTIHSDSTTLYKTIDSKLCIICDSIKAEFDGIESAVSFSLLVPVTG